MTDAQERAEEQRFWDAAFCAALTGVLAMWAHPQSSGLDSESVKTLPLTVSDIADAALAARRQRKEQE